VLPMSSSCRAQRMQRCAAPGSDASPGACLYASDMAILPERGRFLSLQAVGARPQEVAVLSALLASIQSPISERANFSLTFNQQTGNIHSCRARLWAGKWTLTQ